MPLFERVGVVGVWWFPRNFSQSRYGRYQQTGTNSCTLISLLMADFVAKQTRNLNYFFRGIDELPLNGVKLFAAAINDGNSVYKRAYCNGQESDPSTKDLNKGGSEGLQVVPESLQVRPDGVNSTGSRPIQCYQNLSIPEAMQALQDLSFIPFELRERFFTHLPVDRNHGDYIYNTAAGLTQIFRVGVDLFKPTVTAVTALSSCMFAAVIADNRTVIFIIEFPANAVALFDSHQHGRRHGAIIAQASLEFMFQLAHWFVRMMYEVYHSKPTVFEVSFLTPSTEEEKKRLPVTTNLPHQYKSWSAANKDNLQHYKEQNQE